MTIPESPKTYQGNQVIINSDRLVFNAKKDSILLYSDKSIGFSANGNFHFDTKSEEDTKFIVNSPNIYLGIGNLKTGELPSQPAVLGHKLKKLLEDICDVMDNLAMDTCFNTASITTADGTPGGMNSNNNQIAVLLKGEIDDVRKDIDSIMSENTKLV